MNFPKGAKPKRKDFEVMAQEQESCLEDVYLKTGCPIKKVKP